MTNPHSAEVKEILTAYPPNHPDFKDWNCCGGNDATPKQHTMDCFYRAVVCLEGLQKELDKRESADVKEDKREWTISREILGIDAQVKGPKVKDLKVVPASEKQRLQTLLEEAVKVIEFYADGYIFDEADEDTEQLHLGKPWRNTSGKKAREFLGRVKK